jgi:hypothetical protein
MQRSIVLIEILREFGPRLAGDDPTDGGLPGGVGPVGPIVKGDQIQNSDILREVLNVASQLKAIKKSLNS